MRFTRLIAVAGVSLVAMTSSAWAQEAASEEGYADDEIIVQARRKDESVQDVPLVVQAVSGQDLQRLEIRRFEDVTKVVPGLALSTSGASTSASMRGINFDARASGSSTSIEFYRNDAVISAGALFQAAYDIGQVEVLRGPQGTLRGRASPSGSITVTTRRPNLSEVGGYVSGSVAEDSKWNFNAAVNVPVIGDKLAVRVAGYMDGGRGNEITGLNVPTGAVDKDIFDRTEAIRASVRADPFDGVLLLDFSYEGINREFRQYDQVQSYSNYLSTAVASPRLITPSDYSGVGVVPRVGSNSYKLYNWQAQLNLAGQRLTYVGARTVIALMLNDPQDDGGLLATSTAVTPPTGAPTNLFEQLTNSQTKQTTHEIRLQNEERIFGMFDYVLGGFKVSANSPTILAVPGGVNMTVTPGTPNSYTLNSFTYSARNRYRSDSEESLFGNITMHLGENTELSGGMRHIWYKADSGLAIGSFATDPSTWADQASVRRCFGNPSVAGCKPTKEATIYNASLKHNFNDDVMAYATYGTSWRPGNSVIGYRGADVGAVVNNFLNLPDETSRSFELGLKTSWFDKRMRFNISGFHQKFNNYPFWSSLSVPTTNFAGTTLVTGFNFVAPVPTKIKGFEAEFSFDITDRLTIGSTVAFADGQVKNGVFPCVDLDNNNVHDTNASSVTAATLFAHVGANQIDTCTTDASPSTQARWSGTMQAEYSMPVGDIGEAYLRGFTSWKGYSRGDSLNVNDQVKSYALVDLFAGLRDEDGAWEVSLFAKNLFNTKRVLTRSESPLGTPISAAGTLNNYNYLGITTLAPQEFGVNVRFAFGSR